MPRVWISIGSNIEPARNVAAALAELRGLFGDLVVSPVYEAPAVGFDAAPFLNLVVGVDTDRSPADLHRLMREIEDRQGRQRSGKRFASRTIDLDVLTYGERSTDDGGKHLPRDEILDYAFVLAPLADVAPSEQHPELGKTYAALWDAYRGEDRQGLRQIDLPGRVDERVTRSGD